MRPKRFIGRPGKVVPVFSMAQATLRRRSATDRRVALLLGAVLQSDARPMIHGGWRAGRDKLASRQCGSYPRAW